MISVVVFKWRKPGYRSRFTAEHVNTMASMVRRHYRHPHRFICITDDPVGLDERIEAFPMWKDHLDLLNPTFGKRGPNCYPRLRAFSRDFREIAGDRFVCLDLDAVIVGDLTPLWHRPEDFVIWECGRNGQFNGSMWMMSAGARSQVWDDFDPVTSPKKASKSGARGSDQGWIWYKLKGNREAVWRPSDGVLSFRDDLASGRKALPPHARIVFFWGLPKPWDKSAQQAAPWISEHYR